MPSDEEQRRELRDRAGLALVDAVPVGWRRIDFRFRAVGGVHEASLWVLRDDGSSPSVAAPQEAVDALLELRRVMYEPGEGTWFSTRYMIDPPGRLNCAYNYRWDLRWDVDVDTSEWIRDLETFPRTNAHIPAWLRAKLGGAERARTRPAVARGGLGAEEQNELWGLITNLVVHSVPPDWSSVMLRYRAVGDHVELPVAVRATYPDLYLWTPPDEVTERLAQVRAGMYRPGRGTWLQATATVSLDGRYQFRYTWDDQPAWDDEPPRSALLKELATFPRDEKRTPAWMRERVGPVAVATLRAVTDSDEDVKVALRTAEEAATELGLDPGRYRIGEVADGAWCLTPDGERWAVFLALDGDRLEGSVFDTVHQAVRYFVGQLYLQRAAFRDELPPDARRPADQWPIQPMGDDIGLNLYKGKRLVTLPPGTELDRYGDPTGNTLYTAGTEFPYRSHEAEQAQDEYHVYRLRYTARALTGAAVPWFDQPGGGVAFLLERSVAELLADGVLEEIPHPTVRPPATAAERPGGADSGGGNGTPG